MPNYKKTIRIGWSFSLATDIIILMSKLKFRIKSTKFTEFCGWYGAVAMMLAYALVSFNITAGNGLLFQILNLTGSVGLMIVALSKRVIQSVILEIFWMIIGIVALIRFFMVLFNV